MKLLTVTIPCYNSENYMRNAIECCLKGGEDVEIIVVDDGSTDNTGKIADEYARKFPHIVKAIHQENGGHGEAVNTGIKEAEGLFFKVLDSDDWFDDDSFQKVLQKLKEIVGGETALDLLICNFVYEKEEKKHKKTMTYSLSLPKDTIFGWNEVKHIIPGKYILMHSAIYRTRLLKECGLKLPKHTFYVDNLFVFEPMPYVRNMYYMDVDLYRYYIGRDDQSVNETVMISRIDQQLAVNYRMIDFMRKTKFSCLKQYKYMLSYLEVIMTVSSILLIKEGSEKSLEKKKALWMYLRDKDNRDYFRLRFGIFGTQMNIPGRAGRKISVTEYKIAQKFIGFN